jgi:hypothetical protein
VTVRHGKVCRQIARRIYGRRRAGWPESGSGSGTAIPERRPPASLSGAASRPRAALGREQVLDPGDLSDTAKRGRRFVDTECYACLIGRFTGTNRGRQTGRVDECQGAGFDGDRWRMRREGPANGCPEPGGTSHVELADNHDRGGLDLDVHASPRKGSTTSSDIRHEVTPAQASVEVQEATDDDLREAARNALDAADVTLEELRAQARAGQFSLEDARLAWVMISDIVNLAA